MQINDYPGVAGRCFLITGASSGIGRATAILLDQLGAQVILCGRNEQRLSSVRAQLSRDVHVCVVQDLLKVESMRNWLECLSADAGKPLAGVAHCAGTINFVPLRAYSEAKLQDTFAQVSQLSSNLMNSFCLMKNREAHSSIVLMSSTSVKNISRGNSLYATSRAAVECFARYIAFEYAYKNIRCNTIRSGLLHDTKMSHDYVSLLGKDNIKKLAEKYPLGLGEAHDVASTIVFLLGHASKWITGTCLDVDGGVTLNGG